MPLNTTIELRLDRFLDARTAVRQSIRLYTGSIDDNRVLDFEPEYDVVERVLVFRFRDGAELHPRTLYTVQIPVPTEEEDSDGLRALDKAPLAPGPVPLEFNFMTGETREPARQTPDVQTCEFIVETIFQTAGCASENCHHPGDLDRGRLGMDLYTQAGLVATAIDQVAHQTDLGPTSGATFENPPRFGTNMPRIGRDAPENSYMLYKLLRDPLNLRPFLTSDSDPCEPDRNPVHNVLLPEGECFAPSQEEADRLREWFVRGESMPIRRLPNATATVVAEGLTRRRLRELQTWIRAGAPCL